MITLKKETFICSQGNYKTNFPLHASSLTNMSLLQGLMVNKEICVHASWKLLQNNAPLPRFSSTTEAVRDNCTRADVPPVPPVMHSRIFSLSWPFCYGCPVGQSLVYVGFGGRVGQDSVSDLSRGHPTAISTPSDLFLPAMALRMNTVSGRDSMLKLVYLLQFCFLKVPTFMSRWY